MKVLSGKDECSIWMMCGLVFSMVGQSVLAAESAGTNGLAITLPEFSIKHRFVAMDESRSQLVYVNQNDASKNWAIQFPGRYRDYQLIGGNKVMVSSGEGYREYSLDTKQMLKEVKGFGGTMFARRRADGCTVLGQNAKGSVEVVELDQQDKVLRKASYKFGGIRLGRLTQQGTVLFGAGSQLMEGALDGKVVKDLKIEGCKSVYQGLRKADGHLLVAGGYSFDFVETDAEGKVLKRFGGKDTPEAKALGYHFFSGFQVLKNGNVVVANWTGHGAKDSDKGVQIVEFNSEGKLVWAWHDPKIAGSIHGVMIMDDLDAAVLNDDLNGMLGPVAAR